MAIILDLPAEIVQLVGKDIDYTDAQNLRLVCRDLCRSANPIALSKFVLSVDESTDLTATVEKWIAYASRTAIATANGYVQTLRIRNIGIVTSFKDPAQGGTIVDNYHDPQWYLSASGAIRVGSLIVEIINAIPHLNEVEWHVTEDHPMNRFFLDHFKSLDLLDLKIQLLAPATNSRTIPEDHFQIGKQDAFKGLRSLKLSSWFNSDHSLLQEWIAETIRQSPGIRSLTIYHPVYVATDSAPSFLELLPQLPDTPEVAEQDGAVSAPPFFPLQLEHLSVYGLRVSFNDPRIICHLKHIRSLTVANILYNPPVGVQVKNLWKPLKEAGIYPELIEFNLSEVEDEFMDYLLMYPPNRLKSLKLDNRALLWQIREDMDKVAVRFYGEVLKKENVRDSLEELIIVTRDPEDNWCWGRVPGMVEAIGACGRLTIESCKVDFVRPVAY